ncbi:MAD1L1, partial [Symbiodinium microadriaticum]
KDLECMAEAQTARVKAEDELRLAQRAETHGGEEQVAWQLEKRQLKLKCEDLFGELLSLQKATGLDFIPGKTKVLHVKHSANPSLLRYGSSDDAVQTQPDASDMIVAHSTFITPMDELRHLRKEVKALRHLQSTSAPSQSTLLDTSISLCNTSSAMTTTASTGGVDSNKMNARLKEMFRERINSYREAVYLLFGYKVELYSADVAGGGSPYPQLKLRSMYAESPDDSLVFQMKGDILELMETPFATGLDESLLHTLQTSNAVPVFLANVSLDLFEKQTFMG